MTCSLKTNNPLKFTTRYGRPPIYLKMNLLYPEVGGREEVYWVVLLLHCKHIIYILLYIRKYGHGPFSVSYRSRTVSERCPKRWPKSLAFFRNSRFAKMDYNKPSVLAVLLGVAAVAFAAGETPPSTPAPTDADGTIRIFRRLIPADVLRGSTYDRVGPPSPALTIGRWAGEGIVFRGQ